MKHTAIKGKSVLKYLFPLKDCEQADCINPDQTSVCLGVFVFLNRMPALKVPNKNCSRQHFNFLLLSFEEIKLDFSRESSA